MNKGVINYTKTFVGRGKSHRVFAVLTAIFILCGSFFAVIAISGHIKRDIPAREGAIYLQGGIAYYKSVKKSKPQLLRFSPGCASVVSTDGELWWFIAPTASGEEYDLYSMDSGKEPKLREHDVENWLEGSADCSTLLFKKKGTNGATELFCFTEKGKKKIKLAENIEKLWLPDYGNDFWYSKTQYGTQALWRGNLQGGALMIESDVECVTLTVNDRKTTPQLLYLRRTKDSSGNTLCLLNQGSDDVVEIAAGVDNENLTEFLNEYSIGGNIYFFKQQSDSTTKWRDILKDKNADADNQLKEPKKEDYWSLFGLYSPSYNMAMRQYEEKLTRDRVRHELDELEGEKGLFPSRKILCVWDGKDISELCATSAEDILAKRLSGTPGVAVALREPQASEKDIEDYAVRAEDEDLSELLEEARAEIVDSIGNERLCLVLPSSKGIQFSELSEEYKRKSTSFAFSENGYRLYGIVERKVKFAEGTAVRQDIYVQNIEGRTLSPRTAVQIDAQQTKIIGNSVWCILPSAGGKALGDLNRIPDGRKERKEKVEEYVLDYSGDEISGMLIFHHPVDLEENMPLQSRLSFWHDGKTVKIDQDSTMLNESVKSFGNGGILYLVPYVSRDGGSLRLWKNGKVHELSKEVEKVLVF